MWGVCFEFKSSRVLIQHTAQNNSVSTTDWKQLRKDSFSFKIDRAAQLDIWQPVRCFHKFLMPTESCINSRLNSIHFWVECLQTFELQNTIFSRKMHFLQTWTAYLLKWATMTSFCHLESECQDFKCTKFNWTTRCRCKLKLLANKLAASCLCRRSADVDVQF